jgi:putative DNA methylase
MSKRTIIANRFATPANIDAEQTGWRTRGYLPHFDSETAVQFVTFRLANSLPVSLLNGWKHELATGKVSEIEHFRRVELSLDKGHGPGYLANPDVAELVTETLKRFDGDRYQLFHWVLMPTHAHIMLRADPRFDLAKIMHSIKSYTANTANKILGRTGSFWAPEYFDRYIRDGRHFIKVADYIHQNPVKAGLCATDAAWPFGCAEHHEC